MHEWMDECRNNIMNQKRYKLRNVAIQKLNKLINDWKHKK